METITYTDRDVQVGALKLHYQEWGNPAAPPILMLHGFGVSGHMFDEFAERMQDRYRLIALDQRGHGDSDWAGDGDYSRDAFVNDVEGFRKALGLERFILVGHSMGGLNAVSYAVQHSENVRSLILVDVGPEAAREGVDNIVRFTRGPDNLEFEEFVEMAHRFNQRRSIENIRERMRHRLRPAENGKWTWKFDRRFREGGSALRIGSELTGDQTWQLFRDVPVPTLLVRGGESDVLKPDVADRAVREMQRARLTVVPGAGHSVPGDNPAEFTAAVVEFLAGAESAASLPPQVPAAEPSLDQLVKAQKRPRKRSGSMLPVVIVGAGAIAVLLAGLMAGRRHQRRNPRPGAPPGDARRSAPSLDVSMAQQRALDLLNELTAVGRENIERARGAVHEFEVDRARHAAHDVLVSLGDRAAHAPAAVRAGANRARRSKKQNRSGAASVLRASAGAARWLLKAGAKPAPRRRTLAWRS